MLSIQSETYKNIRIINSMNFEDLPPPTDVMAELSADDRMIVNKKSRSYFLGADGSHSDKQK